MLYANYQYLNIEVRINSFGNINVKMWKCAIFMTSSIVVLYSLEACDKFVLINYTKHTDYFGLIYTHKSF